MTTGKGTGCIRFSVIIPTRGRPERLSECLEALWRLDYPRHRFEVIVVDDGTEPVEAVETVVHRHRDRIGVELVAQSPEGPAAARNRGAKQASHPYLAFTDDDCRPCSGWLAAFARHFENHPFSMAGGRTRNGIPDNLFSEAGMLLHDFISGRFAKQGKPFIATNNMALPRSVFEDLGGFDDRFPLAGGEDRDFCARCVDRDIPLHFIDAPLDHHHALTLASFFRQQFHYGRGGYRFRRVRAQRKDSPLHLEPVRFYLDLLRHPLSRSRSRRPLRTACLFVLSQLAVTGGFLAERIRGR